MAQGESSRARNGGAGSFSSASSAAALCCPQHPEAHLVEDYHAGDMVCPECGLVVGDRSVRVCVTVRIIIVINDDLFQYYV